VWHDHHIKHHTVKNGDLVLMYDNKYTKCLGKFQMHCLGSYVIKDISDGGTVHLENMIGEVFTSRINRRRLKVYKDDSAPMK